MILELDRIVADWLADATHGVNALLASTPLDTGDSTPASIALVTDETRNGDAARGLLPASRPCIVVSCDVIDHLEGQVMVVDRDGQVKLRVRIGLDNATTEGAVRDLSYYLRTVIRSLNRLFDADANDAVRTRNDIYLETCLEMKSAIAWSATQGETPTVTGYVFPTVQIRDTKPKG